MGINPPGKSRRRRQQGCGKETFPIHHPAVGRTSSRLGGHGPPPCRGKATEVLVKGHGQADQPWQGRGTSTQRCDHAETPKEKKTQTKRIYFKGRGGRKGWRRQSSPCPFLIPPALASHLGKVKISRKRLQIGLTPPHPLNKVYYRPGPNPFKSPTRGEGPGLGKGRVIPMNLLQGDLGSAGRADGPGPSSGSGKQPFSLMIPNKDKRAERIGDSRRLRRSWSRLDAGMLTHLCPLRTTGRAGTELQLCSSR